MVMHLNYLLSSTLLTRMHITFPTNHMDSSSQHQSETISNIQVNLAITIIDACILTSFSEATITQTRISKLIVTLMSTMGIYHRSKRNGFSGLKNQKFL